VVPRTHARVPHVCRVCRSPRRRRRDDGLSYDDQETGDTNAPTDPRDGGCPCRAYSEATYPPTSESGAHSGPSGRTWRISTCQGRLARQAGPGLPGGREAAPRIGEASQGPGSARQFKGFGLTLACDETLRETSFMPMGALMETDELLVVSGDEHFSLAESRLVIFKQEPLDSEIGALLTTGKSE